MQASPERVVVVGRGALGLAIALRAAQRGLAVTVVGRAGSAPGAATGAAGAMLGTFGEVSAESEDIGAAEEELVARRAAQALHDPIFDAIGADRSGVVQRGGTVVVAGARSRADRRNLAAIRDAADRHGSICESVDPDDLAYLSPSPDYPLVDAVFLPDEAWIDTERWLVDMETHLSTLGVDLVDAQVNRVITDRDSVTGVKVTNDQVISADAVVVAAGSTTSRLLDQSGFTEMIPAVFGGKGTSLVLQPAPPSALPVVVRTPNRAFACGVHLVPRGGHVYVGATNRFASLAGATGRATAGEIHLLLHSAIHELDTRLAHADVVSLHHGDRPISADGRPIVGATAVPGLLVATGTYRNGILLAPLVAETVLAALFREPTPPGVPTAWDPRSRPDPTSASKLLRASAPQVIEMLLEPGGGLPYDNEERLHAFLDAALPGILELTVDGTPISERLAEVPLVELVPELLVLLAADARSTQ